MNEPPRNPGRFTSLRRHHVKRSVFGFRSGLTSRVSFSRNSRRSAKKRTPSLALIAAVNVTALPSFKLTSETSGRRRVAAQHWHVGKPVRAPGATYRPFEDPCRARGALGRTRLWGPSPWRDSDRSRMVSGLCANPQASAVVAGWCSSCLPALGQLERVIGCGRGEPDGFGRRGPQLLV